MNLAQMIFRSAPKGPALGHTLLAYKAETPRFQGISRDEAAVLLSRFVEEGVQIGWPWRLQKPGWGPAFFREIGVMEALDRLDTGQAVGFQPQRLVAFGLSAEKLINLAYTLKKLVQVIPPEFGETPPSLARPEPTGLRLNLGGAMVVSDFADLKILFELFTPWQWQDLPPTTDPTERIARQLSRFVTAHYTSAYPWSVHESATESLRLQPDRVVWHMVSGGLQAAGWGTVVGLGAVAAAAFAGIALSVSAAQVVAGGAGLFLGNHWLRGLWRVFRERTGLPLTPLEAFGRLAEGGFVLFQRRRAVGIPILKGVAWFGDTGRPERIDGPGGLRDFFGAHTPPSMTQSTPS